ncbi:MAG: pantetheine-phosphate adenylyltransferase [Actinomycetota bacterium]|nr:pantetheine-phosphate adenylyltransferase [Actinomycetota bacterium]
MAVAICPGSFDPPTNGHIDVVERASRHFDRVIVSVVANPSKAPMFDAEERVSLLKEVLGHLGNVDVASHDGLLVDFARVMGADVIVKGFRAVSDFDYELQMSQMNSSMMEGIDTLFIATNPKWSYISSSLVKEVAKYGGDVSPHVPPAVFEAISRRFGR